MLNSKITVLIPTYHRPAMLARAVDSIVNQSFTDFIVRIHDNGSDNDTLNLVNNLVSSDSRIEYHRHAKNIGPLSNFQSLVDSIDTPFYSIISDDDFFLPGHLEAGIKKLTTYPEAYFYSSATATVNLLKNKIEFRNQIWSEDFYRPSEELTCRISSEHFTSTGTIFSRKVLSKMNSFHSLGMDDVLSVLLTGCFPFVASPRIGAVFTVNEKRDRWHTESFLTIEQILRAGAIDRKFVIDHAPSAVQSCLLKYLESIYGSLLERKAMHLFRIGVEAQNGLSGNYCESIFFKFLLRSSVARILKTYGPNNLLDFLSYFLLITKKSKQAEAVNELQISHFENGHRYLKNFDLDQKKNFHNELSRVKLSHK